jgi:hypothetical protein
MTAPRRCRHSLTVARVILIALFLSPAFMQGQQNHGGGDMQSGASGSRG